MIFEKSESRKLKCAALHWLRLDQRCVFIATEAGGYCSDVIGINEKKFIEIEIKISKEDLRADFKKHKHHEYLGRPTYGIKPSTGRWIPNQFYFAVPKDLVEFACQQSDERSGSQYGVISADDFKVVKRAKWLHKRLPDSAVKHSIALRMGSELLRFHEAHF